MISSIRAMLLAGVVAMLIMPGDGARAGMMENVAKTGELRVGWAEWNPFQTRDIRSGELKGVLIDLANEIASRVKVKATFTLDGWATLPSGIAADKFSVAIMSISPGRAQVVAFTRPIYSSDFTAIVSSASGLASWDDVNKAGNTIATTTGSAGDEALTALEKDGKVQAEIVRIKDVGAAILAIKTGKNSAYINQRDLLTLMAKQQQGLRVVDGRFGTSPAGLALPKADPQALAALDKVVAEMNADGTTQALFKKHGIEGIQIGAGTD